MTCLELRIIPTLLQHIVHVPVNKELDSLLECNLVGADGLVYLCFFACVKAVDVKECAVAATETFAESYFVAECAFYELEISEGEEVLVSFGCCVSG
jgi:hypothetical protein